MHVHLPRIDDNCLINSGFTCCGCGSTAGISATPSFVGATRIAFWLTKAAMSDIKKTFVSVWTLTLPSTPTFTIFPKLLLEICVGELSACASIRLVAIKAIKIVKNNFILLTGFQNRWADTELNLFIDRSLMKKNEFSALSQKQIGNF